MTRLIDLTGMKFHRLSVIRRAESASSEAKWLCLCDCGHHHEVAGTLLRDGRSKSCGCYKVDIHTVHGCNASGQRTAAYASWAAMIQRCTNKNAAAFPRYGGVGISVCDEWRLFENFLRDMGEPPSDMTIDRIDGAKGYNPSNCRWATRKEQQRNIKSNRLVTHDGETLCVSEWCERTGLNLNTFYSRLGRGWSEDKILRTPVLSKNRNGRTINASAFAVT